MPPRRRDDASAALNALGVSLEGATLSKDAIVKLLKARAGRVRDAPARTRARVADGVRCASASRRGARSKRRARSAQ
jgi:hypothetical protein